jgi:hypothetical protein
MAAPTTAGLAAADKPKAEDSKTIASSDAFIAMLFVKPSGTPTTKNPEGGHPLQTMSKAALQYAPFVSMMFATAS